MKVYHLSTIEEIVLNPQYKGWRIARIEAYVDGEHYPVEVGHIRIYNNDELFNEIYNIIDNCVK